MFFFQSLNGTTTVEFSEMKSIKEAAQIWWMQAKLQKAASVLRNSSKWI